MGARVRRSVERRLRSGRGRRRVISAVAAVALVTAGLITWSSLSGAATTNGDPVTWSQTECIALVGGGTLGTPIDITVDAVVPNTVNLGQSYTATTPGGTTTLPSSSNGFTIGSYNNLNQTYLFRSSAGSPQITSATPAGPAVNNGNNVAYNASFTNEGTSTALSTNPTWDQVGGGTITYTTATPHPFQVGQLVDISGMTNTIWQFLGAVVTQVPTSTTFTIQGKSIATKSGTWTNTSPTPTLTYESAFPSGLKVGDTFYVYNAVPARYTLKKTVSAVLDSTHFQALDSSGGGDPGPITTNGIIDTLANPSGTVGLGTVKGSIKSLTTVTLSTPNANPGTLTVPDTNIAMTAPNVNATVTSYNAVVLTTANLVGPGPAATTCNVPHASPQTDGISATLVGTGGPTTTAYTTCRPIGSTCTPAIASISPTSGPASGGTSVTIGGFNFSNITGVSFGATPAASFTVNSDRTITATAPAGTGIVDVTATNATGTSSTSAADQFTYIGAPSVTSVTPNNGPTGGGTSVTIAGSGFTGATAVNFGATAATTFTVNSDTQITATAPAHGAGAVDVTVTGPGGTSTTGAGDQYTYVTGPSVSSVSPAAGPTGGGTSVTITGSNFTGATAVKFGASNASSFTVNSNTSITATSPAHAAGTVDVTVVTPGGTSPTGAADQFTFVAAPTVTSISPTTGPAAGGTSVTIAGTGFTAASAVKFGATNAATFSVDSDTQITATSPGHGAGAVDVTVTTAGGTSSTGAGDQFTFVAAPTVTSISPTSGSASGGTSVTITGTGFTNASAVQFGATAATTYTVNNDTQITATSPAHAAGIADVTVTTTGGTSATSANDQFTFVGAPTVSSISPTSGPAAGGTSVTITGSGFTGASAVKFGATNAATFNVDSDTQITATTPVHAAGTVDLTVTTTGGTSATSANDQFTFVAAPTVASVNPTSGQTAGGTTVTITGTGFTGATAAKFGTTAATTFNVDSDTQITATSPAHAAGTVDVTITTPGGTSATSANDQFTFVAPASPTVTGVIPAAGATTGGTAVTITGSGFTGASAVNFGATAATSMTVNNDGSITATSPAHAAGTVDVTVTTPNGTSTTAVSDQFTFVAAPTVTSVSPNSGSTAGGTSVTITGTDFTTATAVDFGGTPASTFNVDNDTQITATSPAGAAGTVDVTVIAAGGTSAVTNADQFTYTSGGGGGPTQAGDCAGQVLLATPSPALTDTTHDGLKITGALAADQGSKAKIGGTCSAQPRPSDPHIPPAPGSLTPKSVALSLLGNTTCANGSGVSLDTNATDHAWPVNGKITWTMNENYVDPITSLTHPYKIQAALTILAFGQNGNGPDVADVRGIVLTGLAPGATVTGNIWQDPVKKTGGATGYNTGYELDTTNLANCSDATAGNASITKLLIGGGGASATSPVGSTAEGIKFELGQ